MCGEQRASAELVLQASVWSEHSHQLFPANARMRVSSLFPIVYRAPPGKTLSLIAISPGGLKGKSKPYFRRARSPMSYVPMWFGSVRSFCADGNANVRYIHKIISQRATWAQPDKTQESTVSSLQRTEVKNNLLDWGACRFPELPDELWPWWRGCRPTVVIVIHEARLTNLKAFQLT